MTGWLDQNSLARFVVEVVEQLDITAVEALYRGGGSAPYPPSMMLALVFYCYAKGIFSSRKIERASYELIPVLYITGGKHPDHDSINTFRQRCLTQMPSLFVQILEYACGLGIFKLGEISIDGTKIKANASQHKALSWEYACKLETQLQGEVATLLAKAASDLGPQGRDIDMPQEVERRSARLAKIGEIKAEIEQRAQIRYAQEQVAYAAKLAERAAKEQSRGRKLGGKPPQAPTPGPRAQDQVNFTDPESRIMPMAGGGFAQAYNAQATVDMATLLIVDNHVSQHPNDQQEVAPALAGLDHLPASLGKVEKAALDAGFFSAAGLQPHYPSPAERFAPLPAPPVDPDPVAAMQYRLKTEAGQAFYAKRKSTVEPVFGIIKEVMGFRRFMLRGFQAVSGEWSLVAIAFNLKRLCVLSV
jgi:transposase